MKILKSHFQYSKSQRNGIFLLITISVVLQALFFWLQYATVKTNENSTILSQNIMIKLDSLNQIQSEKTHKIYPFNPNYLSDYKAYQLGMSVKEIDRLMAYRNKNKYVNSVKEFQNITKVSDTLLHKIAPYFKFPTWVTQKNKSFKKIVKNKIAIKDINTATVNDLEKIKGIGKQRAVRILKYRKLLGGYTFNSQLKEVYGIPNNVLQTLLKEFKVISKPKIKKINVNTASVYNLSKIVYIDVNLAKSIINYRKEVAEIQSLQELKIIKDFPVDKFHLINLYLQAY